MASVHIGSIRRKIEELRSMEQSLTTLNDSCAGDDRADCPILDNLAGHPTSG
jgi:hypothetical protein